MPFERMRVGMSSDRASQTQTPGADREERHEAEGERPRSASRCARWAPGVTSAFSILSGATRASSRFANGLEKKATTLFGGTQPSRVIEIGAAVASSERTTFVADRKSP